MTVCFFIHFRYNAKWRTMAVPELFANVPIKPGQDEPVGEARNKVLSLVGAVLIVTLPINKIVFLLYVGICRNEHSILLNCFKLVSILL